jgi:DNA-binding CsgD family transcriptional regulator
LFDQLAAGARTWALITAEDEDARQAFQAAADENKAKWAALAAECEAEIARRMNSPGQRSSLIKQLATERKLKRGFLETVLRVYGRQFRNGAMSPRAAEMVRLRLDGCTPKEISEPLGISDRQVRKLIQSAIRPPVKRVRGGRP